MFKKFKISKNISFILIFCMALIFIASCNKNPSGNSNNNSSLNTENLGKTTTDLIPEKIVYKADYLPEADYGGYEFRIVCFPSDFSGMYTSSVIEEESGDRVNDAIFRRNRIIEEKYNIIFKQISNTDLWDLRPMFLKSVLSDSDDFDTCMMISWYAWEQALQGTVAPVKDLPYLDISQPWYVQDVNKQRTIAGKAFLAYSDECVNMLEQTESVLFNKKLLTDTDLEDPYNLVRENKWTVEKFFDMAKSTVFDLNGDGQMTKRSSGAIFTFREMEYYKKRLRVSLIYCKEKNLAVYMKY